MENGSILYAGKYSQPDYELILKESCPLAIESGMIGHASDVKAQLEKLGVPVLVDRSSYESHPLGRTEWIKLYGVLLGCEEKAEALFNEQVELMTLTDYDTLVKVAHEKEYVRPEDFDSLAAWRKNPEQWSDEHMGEN